MTPSGHLQIPDDSPCSFCEYLSGRRRYTILRRSRLTATLVTREQRGISHVLVITTRHVASILDLTDDEAAQVMLEIRSAARAIDAADKRPGISIWQNNGVAAH